MLNVQCNFHFVAQHVVKREMLGNRDIPLLDVGQPIFKQHILTIFRCEWATIRQESGGQKNRTNNFCQIIVQIRQIDVPSMLLGIQSVEESFGGFLLMKYICIEVNIRLLLLNKYESLIPIEPPPNLTFSSTFPSQP